MKTLSLILIVLLGFSCNQHTPQENSKYKSAEGYIRSLQKRKALIDKMPSRDTSALMVFVKMNNKNELVRILNGRFPDDSIECTYNVLTDKNKVVMVLSSPYSESGDWDLTYIHYFNKERKTFAYEKQANAFVLPNDGVAYETTTDYFDPNFKNIRHVYKLVDKNKKSLDKKYAFDRGGSDDKIYRTAADCLSAYHITLPGK